MDTSLHDPPNPKYLPAIVPPAGTVAHSSRKLLIAMIEAPDRVCGQALRVGYTGPLQTDLALYRLKVKANPDLPAVTLVGFFVLEDGLFHEHE